MSLSITLSGVSSVLESDFFPIIELNSDYEIGLISFTTYNTIPNVDISNNLFHYGENKFIEIPTGCYEISDLSQVINDAIKKKDSKDNTRISIEVNENTFKCVVLCYKHIYFNKDRSIGLLMGFKDYIIHANVEGVSNTIIDIMTVNTIRVDCNIANSSFLNNSRDHVIHEFSPNVGNGYKIIERPINIIYHSIVTRSISNLTLQIFDERNKLINFQGERIICRVHLRPC